MALPPVVVRTWEVAKQADTMMAITEAAKAGTVLKAAEEMEGTAEEVAVTVEAAISFPSAT